MFWFLNLWLTTWRDRVNSIFKTRSKKSDGSIGDLRHQAGYSEHNRDQDGSVDAWDMDVNLYDSNIETGSKDELAEIENLKLAFQADPGSQLWIHKGQIANRDIGNWKRRPYYGANKHDRHVHWQSRSSKEGTTFKAAVGRVADKVRDAINTFVPVSSNKSTSPPKWTLDEDDYFRASKDPEYSAVVKAWQKRMKQRGWPIKVDGYYGPRSADLCRQFQRDKKLKADGLLGPKTFRATWTARIT